MNYQENCKREYDAKYDLTNLGYSMTFSVQFRFLLRLAAVKSHPLRILDLGGGTGEYSRIMQDLGHDVMLVDISEVAIQKAHQIGVKRAICLDFLTVSLDERFDLVLVKGFSPLNTDNPVRFRAVMTSIYSLLSSDGLVLYWANTDLTEKWGNTGWFNFHPRALLSFFNEVIVFPALRYQAYLPVHFARCISRLLCSLSRLPRSITMIGYLQKGSHD